MTKGSRSYRLFLAVDLFHPLSALYSAGFLDYTYNGDHSTVYRIFHFLKIQIKNLLELLELKVWLSRSYILSFL